MSKIYFCSTLSFGELPPLVRGVLSIMMLCFPALVETCGPSRVSQSLPQDLIEDLSSLWVVSSKKRLLVGRERKESSWERSQLRRKKLEERHSPDDIFKPLSSAISKTFFIIWSTFLCLNLFELQFCHLQPKGFRYYSRGCSVCVRVDAF